MFGDVPQEELLRAHPGGDGRRERKEPHITGVLTLNPCPKGAQMMGQHFSGLGGAVGAPSGDGVSCSMHTDTSDQV